MQFYKIDEAIFQIETHIKDLLFSDSFHEDGNFASTSWYARAQLLRLREIAVSISRSNEASKLEYAHILLSLECRKFQDIQCVISTSTGIENINRECEIGTDFLDHVNNINNSSLFERYVKEKFTDWSNFYYPRYNIKLKSEEAIEKTRSLGFNISFHESINCLENDSLIKLLNLISIDT